MSDLAKNIVRVCGRLVVFLLVFAVSYGLVVRFVLPRLPPAVLAHTTMPRRSPVGFTRLMMTEADTIAPVDVLFMGSSHAYQTFDPRFFARYGIRTFDLASLGESPIQNYYMQDLYLKRLHPKLVVLEIWWPRLADDGAESALDLISNMPLSFGLLKMTLATRNLQVYNAFLRRLLDPPDLGASEPPREVYDLRYVSGGFAEHTAVKTFAGEKRSLTYDLDRRELRYLERVISAVRKQGSEIVLVVQPVSSLMLSKITNLEEIDLSLNEFASKNRVQYIDFNQLVALDPKSDFGDGHHLNSNGIRMFLPQFLAEIQQRGFLRNVANTFNPAVEAGRKAVPVPAALNASGDPRKTNLRRATAPNSR